MNRLRLATIGLVVLAMALTGCLGSRHLLGPSLNDEVRDGNFAFTVTAINLGVPKTGDQSAYGVFVVVHIVVKNTGAVARTFYCQNQTLTDKAGKKYDNAVAIGNRENLSSINPGKQVHVTCAFDVPTGALPSTLQLRDSSQSRGATVQLL